MRERRSERPLPTKFALQPVAPSLTAALVLCALLWLGPSAATGTPLFLGGAMTLGELQALLSPQTLVSLASAAALAVATWRLLLTLDVSRPRCLAELSLALPTVFLCTASLAPSEAWSGAACLLALDAAIRRRHASMLLWYGVAFVSAAHAAMFAPFVAAVLIHRRVHLLRWWLAPVGCTVAVLLGWPWFDLAWDAAPWPALSRDAPNLWSVAQMLLPASAPQLSGLAITAWVGVSACFVAHFSRQMPAAGKRLLPVALLGALIAADVSPLATAGGYVFPGLIALVWAITSHERRAWHVALLTQAGSIFAISGHTLGQAPLIAVGLAAITLAIWLVSAPLAQPAANDNAPLLRGWRRGPPPLQPAS